MKWVFLAMLFLYAVGSTAQPRTVFNETFDDNSNSWLVEDPTDGVSSAAIENGVYRVSLKENERFQYYSNTVSIDKTQDFKISAQFKQIEGLDTVSFGFIFNGADIDNHYQFLVSCSKWSRVSYRKNGEYNGIVDWRRNSAVKGIGEWNTLEIVKENDALACYVNGRFAGGYSYSFYPDFGSYVGILVMDEQTTVMDDLKVVQKVPASINVTAGALNKARPVGLGSGVNREGNDLIDCLSPDGSLLFFNRKGYDEIVGDKEVSDIYISQRRPDGTWSDGVHLGKPLNNEANNYAVAITQDLNTLFVQGTYKADGSGDGPGISISKKEKNGWSVPVSMPIEDYYNNADSYANSHISPDGNVLMYTLERTDTKGATDLYVCFKNNNGGWTAPKNIGGPLNSNGFEAGPYIAADGKTMYFASNGHPGYGGMDNFVTTRLDDTWLKWSQPKNLGEPINSDENDYFFQVPARGDSGYFSSYKNTVGRTDIFSVALPASARPEAMLFVKGRVLNANTKEPIEASVLYESLTGEATLGNARSSPVDGAYSVFLSKGKLYGIHAEAEGYFPLSEQFDARELGEYAEVEKDLLLTPVELKTTFRLNNLFFDFAKYDLRTESFPELNRLATFLNSHPTIIIELSGHTDNVGADKDNQVLSQNRTNSVKKYLETHGVQPKRLTAKGYGETKPIASNDTDDGRQLNRRVEFTIMQK